MMVRRFSLAAIAATALLAGLVPAAAAQLRVSPNYRLNADSAPFRGLDQVGLAVNPNDANHVVAVFGNYLDSRCQASASFDGGRTWSGAFTLPFPTLTGASFPRTCTSSVGGSQYIAFGTGQRVYTATVAQKREEAFGFSQDASALLYRSADGGVTWQTGVVAMAGGPGGIDPNVTPGPIWYRPAVAVHRGGGAGGADRVYLVARNLRTVPCAPPGTGGCSQTKSAVSNDGGATWAPPVDVSPPSTNTTDFPSRPVVNSDGSVTVAYRTVGVTGLLQAARTTNAGASWSVVDVAQVTNTGTSTQTHVMPTPPSGQSTSASYPRMAGDPNIPGRLYMVYIQGSGGPSAPPGGFQGADHFISPDSAVWFQRSSNGGQTWSTPRRISDATSFPGSRVHQTRHANVSVSSNGRVNIVWHDRRHWYQGPGERMCSHSHIFCEDIRLGDTYYATSTDGGQTFSRNIRVNDRSHNNEVGYDTRPSGYWWFAPDAVGIAGDDVLVAWMDSREGNWDTDTEDIYLARIDFDATGPAPRTHVDAPDAVARSVELSKLGYIGGNEGALTGGPRDPAGAGSFGPASRNASAVVIANEADVAAALVGSVLGRANPAPVLLSPAGGLPASVRAEVARLRPAGAYLLGDTSKLSEQVRADLVAAGVPGSAITRIGGNDAAIAAGAAAAIDRRLAAERTAGSPAFDAAVIANPASPDAAAAAGLAAARRLPFLWAGTGPLPAETQAALASLSITATLVIGGPDAVGSAVLGSLPNPTRLGGADQYATSREVVAESAARGLPGNVVYVADGARPMDAALLAGVVARATGTLVLARAPLYGTAVGQAEAFGLGGASRYVLLGPPAPVAPPPPAPPAAVVPPRAVPPPPPPAADTRAPTARLGGARRQRLGAFVTLTITCTDEPCRAVVAGTVRVPRIGRLKARTLRLRGASAQLRKGQRRTFRVRISSSARLSILRVLKRRRGVSARLTIRVTDAAGNSRRLTRTVAFRR